MGAGASSIPDSVNKEQCKEIVGLSFSEGLKKLAGLKECRSSLTFFALE